MTTQPFSLCVYCGSRNGALPDYEAAARAVGREIGRRGWQLVYGGGKVGLMGAVADAVLDAGGRAVGVIPRSLMDREVGHAGLHELHVVDTMHQRKQMMAERSDAFLALPGGIGTFEELFEVWTWRQLGYHDKPIGLLNAAGYYDGFVDFIAHTVRQGFLSQAQQEVLLSGTEPAELLERLAAQAARADAPDDYRRI
ncbi:TIGR00730 family Rossman fold protein [Caldimonas tepidiphila]|uniref:TIGR00730 family Rossman fold protein n=1 Tax=Caldimonas tepidiphila TaxID=2315841 RepID=UPI000E5B931E|nr:TIGR00730 family Rossman fold protein [Caldimonas tepidiphila]